MSTTPILIAGPTASGKSHLALRIAEAVGGALINTDSMQVYSGLRLITARPSAAEEARVPHHLYGVVEPRMRCSVGQWVRMAEQALAAIQGAGLTPIFVGGTGLYFRALTEGLSAIPSVPPAIRAAAEARLASEGLAALYADLKSKDPDTANRLGPTDSQRIQRAWEVWEATGRSLASWQEEAGAPLIGGKSIRLALEPARDWLYARCDSRFDQMLSQGALDEVRDIMALGLDPALPAMMALGVRELAGVLQETMTLEDASVRAQMLTRRYAKRQLTWMRNQMADWPRVDPGNPAYVDQALAILK